MNKVLSKKLIPLAALLLSIVLAIASICSLTFASNQARAVEKMTNYAPFPNTELKIENNQFGSSSGSIPQTPDNWTGAGIGSEGASGTISGVIDLDTYLNYKDNIKLAEDYPTDFGGNNRPDSPFGNSAYPDTNRKVLMINVRPKSVMAYGYSSASITFAPSRFYMISAWVRTGNFAPNTGATIRLTGLDESIAFNNINTVADSSGNFNPSKLNENNNYGWKKYTFYIASDAMSAKTVNLSLQVGDKFTSADKPENNTFNPASGYAFFDNINAYEIAPSDFYSQKAAEKQNDKILVKDFSDLKDYTPNSLNGYATKNFNFTKDFADWSTIVGKNSDLSDLEYGIYDAFPEFDFKADSKYNLKEDPVSSLGKFEEDSKILVLSSYKGADEYASVAAGLRSQNITIERYKYYRISAWVKAIDVSGGNGATMILHSKRGASEEKYLNAKISNCVGDDTNKARGGYKQFSFYVKGSSLANYDVNLDLCLGSSGSESKGIALFDNVTIESITPKQFTDNSANGTIVNIDTDAGSDGVAFRTFSNTGIANGEFYLAGDYTNYKFPLPAADWSKFDVSNVGTTGFSTLTDFVDNSQIISGIMPCDNDHFKANRINYGSNVFNPREVGSQLKGSVLLMASSKQTAFCYRSPTFTITAKSATAEENAQASADPQIGKLTVSMFVDNIDGYGANLVLKSGANVISTIENIQNTSKTKAEEFTFYIQPGKTDTTDLSVEIWLGLNDKKDNSAKTSSGNIYVEKVALEMVADKENKIFTNVKTAYDSARQSPNKKISTAVYSFASDDLSAYDYYDNNFVKNAYNYTASVTGDVNNVTHGIFNPAYGLENQNVIPKTFKNSKDAKNKTVLVLKNSAPAASKISLNTKYALEVDKYYKLSVRLKVDIDTQNASAIGAGIYLNGSKFKFDNITSTSEKHDQIIDNEVFQTYNFYIKCGATASTVGLDITLGDSSSTSKYARGIVYVNDISFTDITNTLYEENTAKDKLANNSYALNAVLSDSAETPPETPPTEKQPIHWMVIPSILFAIAILMAIIGFSVRKIIEKRKERRPSDSKKVSSYDRGHTLNKDFNQKTSNTEDKLTSATPVDQTYDKFNDDVASQPIIPVATQTEDSVATTDATIPENIEVDTTPTEEAKTADKPKHDTFTDQFDD